MDMLRRAHGFAEDGAGEAPGWHTHPPRDALPQHRQRCRSRSAPGGFGAPCACPEPASNDTKVIGGGQTSSYGAQPSASLTAKRFFPTSSP
ncbi:hypothetical protein BST37_05925 [Mycobacterium noviomagense]|uniref:Uncharacterized protein n=1 Tax=Mycobacterium noviomagense TaxID=459858 RepID=A0ABX3T8G1_9MYCO|nr:hypothetical protein BST37_05925 [Mycobacterium noviomagense]